MQMHAVKIIIEFNKQIKSTNYEHRQTVIKKSENR